jgi:arsenate reductase-like glutaredoxin family protein
MPKTIDWMYDRKSCKTCIAARSFLAEQSVAPAKDVVNATKIRMGEEEALALAKSVETVVATRGKAIVMLNHKKDKPTDEELIGVLIGPTGNLRAPTLKVGKTLLVGFSAEAYAATLK